MSLATPGAEAFSLEEEERKARKEAQEQFSDEEEDYCHAGSYPEELRTDTTEDSYEGETDAAQLQSDNVSSKRRRCSMSSQIFVSPLRVEDAKQKVMSDRKKLI